MSRRMDRYKNEEDKTTTRSNINKDLYNSFDDTTKYTTISDVRNANIYEIDNKKDIYSSRENYQRLKDYDTLVAEPHKEKKQLDDINYLYKERGNKVYDINSVLEEAKKNRKDTDSNTKMRKIDNKEYQITKEEIEKYRNEKKNRTKPDKEELKELINTITSKTLRGELDQATSVDLLSDLMATNEMDKVKTITDNDEDILDIKEVAEKAADYTPNMDNTIEKDLKNLDPSFYTKSMDLSDKDFFYGDDEDEDEEKKVPAILKVFLILLLLALIGALVYFIILSF